jgi:hypothetical protein
MCHESRAVTCHSRSKGSDSEDEKFSRQKIRQELMKKGEETKFEKFNFAFIKIG